MLCLAARIRLKQEMEARKAKRHPVSAVHVTSTRRRQGKPQARKIIPAMASDRGSSGVKLWSRSEQMKGDE